MKPQVLIVGAGPTGLVLALSLVKQQVPFRIIDKKEGPGEASRAMAVMPRTLEFYDQFGFADRFLEDGIMVEDVAIRVEGKEKARFHIGNLGVGLSRFTSPVTYPQDEHEQFLIKELADQGVQVEWNTELLSYKENATKVETVHLHQGEEIYASFQYICGCDGASSVTRHHMGVVFEGGTYEQEFFVMDLEGEGDAIGSHQLGMCLSKEEFTLFLPVRSSDTTRAIGILPRQLKDKESVTANEVVNFLEPMYQVRVNKVNWFSTYKVHHRVAESFHKGRIFLVGDAAHVHSPVGGQGMNTGIGDAVNLGWKLASVLSKRARESLLDTYAIERKSFANVLVDTTDQAFKRIISTSMVNKTLRKRIVPSLAPLLNRSTNLRKRFFNLLSQIRITYADSPLSSGHDKHNQAGIRLPYTAMNVDTLRHLDWQVHIYGEADQWLQLFCQHYNLLLQEFNFDKAAKKAGLVKNTLYLVRPDGHIGFVNRNQDFYQLQAYLNVWGIIPKRTNLQSYQ